jgi:CBS domain containing-hemolysin-like protein
LNLPLDISYESLGGFILSLIGSVPEKKQEIKYHNYKFIIEKIDRNRILEVLIIKTHPEDEQTLLEI